MTQVTTHKGGEVVPAITGTNPEKFLSELDGGVFGEKLGMALSDVAAAVVNTGNPGRLRIDISIKQLGSGDQVVVTHKLAYERPTARGKAAEEDTTETPMHVGKRGRMSLYPENQHQLFSHESR